MLNFKTIVFPYVFILCLFWVFLSFFVINFGYNQSFYVLNSYHVDFLDRIVGLISHLGDGILLICISVFLIYKKNPAQWWVILISTILGGIFIQILKNFIFTDWLRPLHLWSTEQIHTVIGHIVYGQSFPSGHTMAATITMTGLALVYHQKWIQYLMAFSLIIISFTRVYVGAHFPADVLTSSILGVIFALLSHKYLHAFFYKYKSKLVEFYNFVKFTAIFLLILIPLLRLWDSFPF